MLISIMAVLAACGLIYEYLLSHYAGRVLGIVETAIYTMIGVMIVSMGLGAFAAKALKNPFSAFAWLEATVALIGMSSVLVISAIIGLTSDLPTILTDAFNLPPDTVLEGGMLEQIKLYARHLPYIAGFFLGFFIGMEIPLIARVREQVYGRHLKNNAGTIYGADYIGAGVGAFIWVTSMLTMDITAAAVWTAFFNIVAGCLFLFCYWQEIRRAAWLVGFHVFLLVLLFVIADSGAYWMKSFANVLYKDNVIYQTNSKYQNIVFTEKKIGHDQQIIDMYLNGRLQFSSADEHIYHSMLTYPALLASRKAERALVIGGGDGLAVRNILEWDPDEVVLIDLDRELVGLFSEKYALKSDEKTENLRAQMLTLNQGAFEDERVSVIFGDAFIEIEPLLAQQKLFDVIVVDLPDPSHPDLNKLYSDYFYARLRQILSPDGAIVVQSTSPYHAHSAFVSVGKTMKQAGYQHVEQFRQNVPSFGEWGWTIATKQGSTPSSRIREKTVLPVKNNYITHDILIGAFAMPANFYQSIDEIKVNYLGSGVLYDYHTRAWQKDVGVFTNQSASRIENE
ncbi:polyamine aminopropyltransferase [Aliikangiella marina]|uniref:Polyamine aminopropyltransferase n=2 Tax=Aliikangiella marina TaxID=1712262 RepID=A0A545TK48_9GAMM|nr:polyamine aminopropyltransferase [Aliikangiella marina]